RRTVQARRGRRRAAAAVRAVGAVRRRQRAGGRERSRGSRGSGGSGGNGRIRGCRAGRRRCGDRRTGARRRAPLPRGGAAVNVPPPPDESAEPAAPVPLVTLPGEATPRVFARPRPRAPAALLLLATLATGFTLWAAQGLLLPVLLAMFFALIGNPIIRLLQ